MRVYVITWFVCFRQDASMLHMACRRHLLYQLHGKLPSSFFVAPPKLKVEESGQLCQVRQIDPEVELAYELVQQFAHLLRTRTGEHLDAWLNKVASSKLSELQAFATGIEKDKDAVRAGLTWWINNGMVEGQVTKLKLIKRQGYGRAGFPLLRKRVLHAR
jgi:transposase